MRSLRARLIIVAAIWVALGVAVAGVLLSAVFKDFLVEQFYDELHVHLDELQGLMEFDDNGQFRLQRPLSDPRYIAPLSGFYWEIQKDGRILSRSTSLEGASMLTVPADGGTDAQVHTHSIAGPTGELLIAERLRWLDATKQPLRIIIGTDKRVLDHELEKFNKVLFWALGGFALSMVAAAALLLLYAMAPFAHLRAALAKVRGNAAPNLSGKFPDEVQPLIDDLNNLLSASGEQILRARAQAGNIAHALKTPLAILVDEAHQLAQKGDQQSAAVVQEQSRRMQSQIDYQIARARTAASRSKPGMAASLTETAASVVRALERLHADRRLRIDNIIPPGVIVSCEVQDLNEILGNLIDNACKHARTKVALRLVDNGAPGFVEIVVEDDGPGLPPEAWDVVFNVGEQWSEQASGSGLGLAIVRDLVQLYGGKITLGQSELGGLRAQLALPEFEAASRY